MFQPGNPGRPKGSLNKGTSEQKDYWRAFFESPEYRKSLKARMKKGTAPHMESYLCALIYGKPRETHDVDHRFPGGFPDIILEVRPKA